MIIYGIPHCDTVKKARAWLQARGIDATFHDFKRAGVPHEPLDAWLDAVGWEALLNRKGTTWRTLDDAARAAVVDRTTARELLLAHPSAIKRPVVEWDGRQISVGFNADAWDRRAAAMPRL